MIFHRFAFHLDFCLRYYIYLFTKLAKRKYALEIPFPRYFYNENRKNCDERNQLIDKWLEKFHDTNEPEEEVLEDRTQLDANEEAAIRIIQKNCLKIFLFYNKVRLDM